MRVHERLRQLWGEFWLAMTFLTTLPAPEFEGPAAGMGLAGRLFPLVGLVIGVLLCVVQYVGQHLFPPLLTAALVVLAWVAMTGGLHLDGLADCCDGLMAMTSRERRLEILRDPRVGSFGATGLILNLVLKTAATVSISPLALLMAPVWGRWLLLWTARQPQARQEGMGAAFANGVTQDVIALAGLLPLILLLFSGAHGLVGAGLAFLAMAFLAQVARKRLGGVTGDVYGLVVEVSEVIILLAFAARPNWG
jgi:adenosylcobinamide-GDP ribazoletransferase